MRLRVFCFVIITTVLHCSYVVAQPVVKSPTAKTVLKTLEGSHPRLMLKDAELAKLKALIAKDPLLAKCVRKMIEEADSTCLKGQFTYHPSRIQSVSHQCLRRVYTLGLAWRLTGKENYARKATEDLLTVCAFKRWARSRGSGYELSTTEMTHAVSVGYDWFYHHFDEATREKIRVGLIRNGLEPGLRAYFGEKPAYWTHVDHNWNQVCNGGLIIGALAVAETDPEYAEKILPEAVRLLSKALVNYGPDGAWMEGTNYWHYATRYTSFALGALESALGTDFGLSKISGVSEAGWFPIYMAGPTGSLFNFADSWKGPWRNLPCLFWLAKRFGNPAFGTAARAIVEKHPGNPWAVMWYVPPGQKPPALKLDKRFRGPVEVVVFRSAWDDPDALFVAAKAGFNQVNHGHLDLGSFVIDALGVRWACDLGGDSYSLRGYFKGTDEQTSQRWKYYRLSSFSHNVPLLDNQNQDVFAKTKFGGFKSTPGRAHAVVDLRSAYKEQAVSVKRGVAMLDRRRVLVQDEFELDETREVAWGMMTTAEIKVDGKHALLSQDGKELRAEILSPAEATFTVESAEQKPPEATNKGFRRLVVRLPARKGSLSLAVLLTPVWPDGKPDKRPNLKPLAEW